MSQILTSFAVDLKKLKTIIKIIMICKQVIKKLDVVMSMMVANIKYGVIMEANIFLYFLN